MSSHLENLCVPHLDRVRPRKDAFRYATSWIQTTATLGLLLALILIALCRGNMVAKDFAEWGWRIPFLISIVLLVFSVYIRLRLNETPIFQKMVQEGKGSKAPLTEGFFHYPNNKYVLLASDRPVADHRNAILHCVWLAL